MTGDNCVGMAMKYLLVASTEACSGKSAAILGVAARLQEKGVEIAYTQPVVSGNATNSPTLESDVQLMAQALSLPPERLGLPLLVLDAARSIDRVTGVDRQDYTKLLQANVEQLPGNLVILEGGANLHEGSLFELATAQVAQALDAGVLLVNRYDPVSSVDLLLSAQHQLGHRLLGCIINDIPRDRVESVQTTLVPLSRTVRYPCFWGCTPQWLAAECHCQAASIPTQCGGIVSSRQVGSDGRKPLDRRNECQFGFRIFSTGAIIWR